MYKFKINFIQTRFENKRRIYYRFCSKKKNKEKKRKTLTDKQLFIICNFNNIIFKKKDFRHALYFEYLIIKNKFIMYWEFILKLKFY